MDLLISIGACALVVLWGGWAIATARRYRQPPRPSIDELVDLSPISHIPTQRDRRASTYWHERP